MIRNRNIAANADIDPGKLRGFGNTTGKVFYVMATSNTLYDDFVATKEKGTVFSTIATALAACTASRGDIVYLTPGYTETVTSAITLSKAGVSLIGLGHGSYRPVITCNGAIDLFTMSGAGTRIENIASAAPETDDQTADINVTAANCTIRNFYSIGSQTAKNKTDIITVASGGNDLLVENCFAYNVTVDCVSWLSLEAAVARAVIRGNVIQGSFSSAAIMDEATATLATIRENIFKNTKAATPVVDFSTGNTTGVFSFNHVSGRHTTLASNVSAGTGMDFFENRVVEEAALNGAVIPAADSD